MKVRQCPRPRTSSSEANCNTLGARANRSLLEGLSNIPSFTSTEKGQAMHVHAHVRSRFTSEFHSCPKSCPPELNQAQAPPTDWLKYRAGLLPSHSGNNFQPVISSCTLGTTQKYCLEPLSLSPAEPFIQTLSAAPRLAFSEADVQLPLAS